MSRVTTDPAVSVVPARDRRLLDQFIRLPWRIYEGDPSWVPPLLSDVRKLLDRRHHPFHEHAQVEYFLALRGEAPVGRIAAIVNHAYNDFHETSVGNIGLFESIDDRSVSDALFVEATDWLRERGMERATGPFNLSTNDELYSPGILLNGFEHPQVLLMAHNPPYYERLFVEAGWEKAKDLLSYWVEQDAPPERLMRALERVGRSIDGLVIRRVDLKRLEDEVEIVKEVYNASWEKNWGFTPLSEAEIQYLAKSLKPVLDPDFALIAEIHGRPVGFALGMQDLNVALRHVDGRLFPFGILKLLWHRRKIPWLRVLTLGLKPEYRRSGIDALLVARLFEHARPRDLMRGECAWILEDNWPMRRALERMGGYVYKTYRVYGKELG